MNEIDVLLDKALQPKKYLTKKDIYITAIVVIIGLVPGNFVGLAAMHKYDWHTAVEWSVFELLGITTFAIALVTKPRA